MLVPKGIGKKWQHGPRNVFSLDTAPMGSLATVSGSRIINGFYRAVTLFSMKIRSPRTMYGPNPENGSTLT